MVATSGEKKGRKAERAVLRLTEQTKSQITGVGLGCSAVEDHFLGRCKAPLSMSLFLCISLSLSPVLS